MNIESGIQNDSTPVWVDSHAHLSMFEPADVAAVLERAVRTGVNRVLVPATGPDDLEECVSLAAEHPEQLVAAVGVHPHQARLLDDSVKAAVQRALGREGVVAVGEIGLDYHYMNSPREDQLEALEWHLDLAHEAGLPVVLHNRESWPDLWAALSRRDGRLRGVCHSFTEGPDEASKVMGVGLMVGISGMVTFPRAEGIRAMAASLDPRQLLVETDSPFLAPVPHRGRRNEPAHVVHVGERLGEELGIPSTELARSTTANFERLFLAVLD
jgi:TatD DNase family protein